MFFKTIDGIDICYKSIDGKMVEPTEKEIEDFVQNFKDFEIEQKNLIATEYQRQRQLAYNQSGLTIEKLVVDLWEKEVEGNPTSSIATQATREQIKLQYPKPSVKQ